MKAQSNKKFIQGKQELLKYVKLSVKNLDQIVSNTGIQNKGKWLSNTTSIFA